MSSELDSNEHFEAIEAIGDCKIGTKVYRAKHKLDGKEYAVKEIPLLEQLQDDDLREIKVMSSLSHKHKVGYHTCWISKQKLKLCKAEVGFDIPMDTTEAALSKEDFNNFGYTNSGTSSSSNNSEDGRFLCIKMELCKRNLKEELNSLDNTTTLEHFIWTSEKLRDIANVVELLHQKSKKLSIFINVNGEKDKEVEVGCAGYFLQLTKKCCSQSADMYVCSWILFANHSSKSSFKISRIAAQTTIPVLFHAFVPNE